MKFGSSVRVRANALFKVFLACILACTLAPVPQRALAQESESALPNPASGEVQSGEDGASDVALSEPEGEMPGVAPETPAGPELPAETFEGGVSETQPEGPDEGQAPEDSESKNEDAVVNDPEFVDASAEDAAEAKRVEEAAEQAGEESFRVYFELIGVNDEGEPTPWIKHAAHTVEKGATVKDLSVKLFKEQGLGYDAPDSEYGWCLNTITSPIDGKVYGWDAQTGSFWQLFVNGVPAETGADTTVLSEGVTISWCYTAQAEVPGSGEVVVNPDASHPEEESPWPGFGSAVKPTDALTPTEKAEESWIAEFGQRVSDPILVGNRVFAAAGNKLYVKDSATGKACATVSLAASIETTARMVYANGLVVIPLQGGILQAVSGNTYETVWVSEKLPDYDDGRGHVYPQQPLGNLTVHDGKVYFGTGVSMSANTCMYGYLACIDIATGAFVWKTTDEGSGQSAYYWAGAVFVGGYGVIGDDYGNVFSFDPLTGETVSTICVGAKVRAGVVDAGDGKTLYAVSQVQDGEPSSFMNKIGIDANGNLSLIAKQQFARYSTSTPTIVDGKIIVGGQSATAGSKYVKSAALYVIDAATMQVEREITSYDGQQFAAPSEIKSSPLVSVQESGTYAYFTCNAEPGGLYCYKLGDTEATCLYEPGEGGRGYCFNSPICGADGTIYYVNDSGTLFALKGNGSLPSGPDVPGEPDTPDTPETPGGSDVPSDPDVPANSGGSGSIPGGSGAAGGAGAAPAPDAPGASFGGSAALSLFGPARHVPLAHVSQGALARATSDAFEARESDAQAAAQGVRAGAASSDLTRERALAVAEQNAVVQGAFPWAIVLAVGLMGLAGAGALLVAARRKMLD